MIVRSRSFAVWLLLLSIVPGTTTVNAQEAPFVSIPKFSSNSEDFRTNVCARQQAVINGTVLLKDALRGLDLTVAITDYTSTGSESLFGLSELGTIRPDDPGLFVVLLDEVANRYALGRSESVVFSPCVSSRLVPTGQDLVGETPTLLSSP